MAHMAPEEFNDMMKRIRKGDKVTCPSCGKGVFETQGDYRTSPGFQCNYCKARINID